MVNRLEVGQIRQDIEDRITNLREKSQFPDSLPLRRLRFNFNCPKGVDGKAYNLLKEIDKGVKMAPYASPVKFYTDTPGVFTFDRELSGSCTPEKVEEIVKALAEGDIQTTVYFMHIIKRGDRSKGTLNAVEAFAVPITPELKAAFEGK